MSREERGPHGVAEAVPGGLDKVLTSLGLSVSFLQTAQFGLHDPS